MSRLVINIALVLMLLAGLVVASGDEQSPQGYYPAALAALSKGDTVKAKRELRLPLQENPLQAEAQFLLASLLGWDGDLDQAVVGYEETHRGFSFHFHSPDLRMSCRTHHQS